MAIQNNKPLSNNDIFLAVLCLLSLIDVSYSNYRINKTMSLKELPQIPFTLRRKTLVKGEEIYL